MSCTEIYAFDKSGKAVLFGTTHNSWRSAMAVWKSMEERHLPQYVPDYVKYMRSYRHGMSENEIEKMLGYKPSRIMPSLSGKENAIEEIFLLAEKTEIPLHERIVLFTTFDNALVRREHFSEVIEAFMAFGGETSLPEQAEILKKMLMQDDIIAAGWNQTSVNADTWDTLGGYNDETGETIPYNCLTGTLHYWIFDQIQEEAT